MVRPLVDSSGQYLHRPVRFLCALINLSLSWTYTTIEKVGTGSFENAEEKLEMTKNWIPCMLQSLFYMCSIDQVKDVAEKPIVYR